MASSSSSLTTSTPSPTPSSVSPSLAEPVGDELSVGVVIKFIDFYTTERTKDWSKPIPQIKTGLTSLWVSTVNRIYNMTVSPDQQITKTSLTYEEEVLNHFKTLRAECGKILEYKSLEEQCTAAIRASINFGTRTTWALRENSGISFAADTMQGCVDILLTKIKKKKPELLPQYIVAQFASVEFEIKANTKALRIMAGEAHKTPEDYLVNTLKVDSTQLYLPPDEKLSLTTPQAALKKKIEDTYKKLLELVYLRHEPAVLLAREHKLLKMYLFPSNNGMETMDDLTKEIINPNLPLCMQISFSKTHYSTNMLPKIPPKDQVTYEAYCSGELKAPSSTFSSSSGESSSSDTHDKDRKDTSSPSGTTPAPTAPAKGPTSAKGSSGGGSDEEKKDVHAPGTQASVTTSTTGSSSSPGKPGGTKELTREEKLRIAENEVTFGFDTKDMYQMMALNLSEEQLEGLLKAKKAASSSSASASASSSTSSSGPSSTTTATTSLSSTPPTPSLSTSISSSVSTSSTASVGSSSTTTTSSSAPPSPPLTTSTSSSVTVSSTTESSSSPAPKVSSSSLLAIKKDVGKTEGAKNGSGGKKKKSKGKAESGKMEPNEDDSSPPSPRPSSPRS